MKRKVLEWLTSFREYITCPDNIRTAAVIFTAGLMLIVLVQAKEISTGNKYIVSQGDVKGVLRKSDEKPASFPLTLRIKGKGFDEEREVTLDLEGKSREKSGKKDGSDKTNDEMELDSKVSQLMSELGGSGGVQVDLPETLEDGSKLTWKKRSESSLVSIVVMIPVLIWITYLSNQKKKRDLEQARKEDVKARLPSFNDELLMLIGSGLTFRDAFRRIAAGYSSKKVKGYFEKVMIDVEKETEEGTSDIITVLTRKSDSMGIREFSRVTGMIRDNQLLGVDLVTKMRSESRMLWEERKKAAEEKGKLADTKLTVPLAILLVSLVMITAAPAIVQVQGG